MSDTIRCVCSGCSKPPFIITCPITLKLVPGRYIRKGTADVHRRRDRSCGSSSVTPPRPNAIPYRSSPSPFSTPRTEVESVDVDDTHLMPEDVEQEETNQAKRKRRDGSSDRFNERTKRSHFADDEHYKDFGSIADNRKTEARLHQHRLKILELEARSLINDFEEPKALRFSRAPLHRTEEPVQLDRKRDVTTSRFLAHKHQIIKNRGLVSALEDDVLGQDFARRKEALLDLTSRHSKKLDEVIVNRWRGIKVMLGILPSDEVMSSRLLIPRAIECFRWPTSLWVPDPVTMCIILVVAIHLFCHLTHRGSEALLAAFRTVIPACQFLSATRSGSERVSQAGSSSLTLPIQPIQGMDELLKSIPLDLDTAIKRLKLDPDTRQYTCCPTCMACYPPTVNEEGQYIYPSTCSFKELNNGSECGTKLLLEGSGRPIKRYIYQDFLSWLGMLFARPGMEARLGDAWKNVTADTSVLRDIWDGEALRSFKGPDGKRFSDVPPNECRLVFSLFVDWFGAYGSSRSAAHASIGVIYLACLNLPLHLRFKVENVYLAGIIPGPREPHVHQLNHFLAPLVDQLIELWNPGVLFTKMANSECGRLVRAVIIPLVCDVPAARKTAGFASPMADAFCSFCTLKKGSITDFASLLWPKRTQAAHRHEAQRWKDAKSLSDRDKITKEHGVRYSELLRLPYWDPTRFVVLDSMHNLFLGLLQHHCRNVWGMRVRPSGRTEDKSDPKTVRIHTRPEQLSWLRFAVNALKKPADKMRGSLNTLRKGYIAAMAHANSVVPTGESKDSFIDALIRWRTTNASVNVNVPDIPDEGLDSLANPMQTQDISKHCVLSPHVLDEVWKDIKHTICPSWLCRPPSNFGSPSHGTLKADEWRSACTVFLPITLIQLWGGQNDTGLSNERNAKMLDNFLDLVLAIKLVTGRSVTKSKINEYRQRMEKYLSGIVDLFKDANIVPNHHLSLHLPDFLLQFGSVHSWWAFPFERYIGALQKIKTNKHLGQMELTMMNSFCRVSNMKVLLSLEGLSNLIRMYWTKLSQVYVGIPEDAIYPDEPDGIDDIKALQMDRTKCTSILHHNNLTEGGVNYVSFINTLNQSFPLPDNGRYASIELQTDNRSIPTDIPVSPFVQPMERIQRGNMSFCRKDINLGDSQVVVKMGETLVAGTISHLFLHERGILNVHSKNVQESQVNAFAVINTFQRLNDEEAARDPFAKYPTLGARLIYKAYDETPIILPMSSVQYHIALGQSRMRVDGKECWVAFELDNGSI